MDGRRAYSRKGKYSLSSLARGQKDTGLGRGDAVDLADPAQHFVERFQIRRFQVGDDVPAAIGGVEAADFGIAAQPLEHGLRRLALDLHHHHGAHAASGGRSGHDGEALDNLGLYQPVDPGPHRRAGDAKVPRQVRNRHAGIGAQQGHQAVIQVIHYQFARSMLPNW